MADAGGIVERHFLRSKLTDNPDQVAQHIALRHDVLVARVERGQDEVFSIVLQQFDGDFVLE